MARKIFISYRRDDHPDFVERIRDWFIMRYERENVFMDFDTIPPGVRFADYIRQEVEQCDAMLAILGPRWMELMREKASKFEEDYVRVEISLALQLGKPIIPICIVDAGVPKAAELPADLRPLLEYNAAFLRAGRDFLDNIERVLEAVESTLDAQALKNAQPYYERANDAMDAGDYDAAMDNLTEAIRLHPNYAEAYDKRGTIQRFNGNFHAAIADYNAAIHLNSKFAQAYNNRGIARYRQDDRVGAIADFMEAIRFDPHLTNAYAGIAESYEDQGQYREALTYYRRYLDVAGRNANDALVKRVKILEERLNQ